MTLTTLRKSDEGRADLERAVKVLHTEAAGLTALAETLDERFSQVVDTVHHLKQERRGRLIVAGIGKSGHIARKVAATLASTGTPAFFLHPGEASHGDLGMVTDNDAVIVFSNSGENVELKDLIAFTRRFGIPLFAVTSNPDSALAKHADTALVMPKVPEACPNGLAPTTSTTMMLALGDALAIALLERAGLSPEQFRVFHPGGKLGQKLLKVTDVMIQGDALPLVPETARMDETILVMTGKNLGSALIVDAAGQLAGIVTDGDLKRHMGPDLLSRPVAEIMSRTPRTIAASALAVEALDRMMKGYASPVTSLVVVDSGKPLGLIRVQECLAAGIA